MLKPMSEWLELLPEPFKSQAIENSSTHSIQSDFSCKPLSWPCESMSRAINYSMSWAHTPQGHEYWSDLHRKYMVEEDEQEAAAHEERRAEREKRKVTYSTSMTTMLESLTGNARRVALYMKNDDYCNNEFANYVTTRGGMLSYLPSGREHKTNPDNGRWLRNGRQEMKPGKLARKLIVQSAIDDNLCDVHFEDFANQVKAYLSIVGDEDGEGKNIKIEVVSGEDIRKYYDGNNYSKVLGDGGTNLWGSCMRYDNCQKYFNIYTENPDKVNMVLALDSEGKVLGRALLWKFDDDTKGMDTIYGSDTIMSVLKTWAIDNDYLYKSSQSCHHHDFDKFAGADHTASDKVVTLSKFNFDNYPYMDSMKFLTEGGKLFNQWDSGANIDKTLRSTSGKWEEYENDEDDDDYVTLENGERCASDDSVYLDYRGINGRVTGYYHNEEACTNIDGDWRLDDDVVEVRGDYYDKDDDRITYVNADDEWYLSDDTVYCEYSEDSIHKDDAQELHDGTYCDEDCASICSYDQLWYCTNDMTAVDGKWVANDNVESYLLQLKEKQNEQERETTAA